MKLKPFHVSYDDGCNIYHWVIYAMNECDAMDQTGSSRIAKAVDGGMKAVEITQPVTLIATEERHPDNIQD
jgi:hypothetical protein